MLWFVFQHLLNAETKVALFHFPRTSHGTTSTSTATAADAKSTGVRYSCNKNEQMRKLDSFEMASSLDLEGWRLSNFETNTNAKQNHPTKNKKWKIIRRMRTYIWTSGEKNLMLPTDPIFFYTKFSFLL